MSPQEGARRGSVLLSVCMYIIVCEFCERLAYYGLAGSLVLLLQDELSYTNADADNQVSKPFVHPRLKRDQSVSLRQ